MTGDSRRQQCWPLQEKSLQLMEAIMGKFWQKVFLLFFFSLPDSFKKFLKKKKCIQLLG